MRIVVLIALTVAGAVQVARVPPQTLSVDATAQLAASLEASRAHTTHVWRDTAPMTSDGLVNAYIEISRGELTKWEFDMRSNARTVDRVIPAEVGGYPVNYGFVPQTISYDGDPFDVLVLGPPLPGGTLVPGVIVGVMFMEDEKGVDSKVVVSPHDPSGRPQYSLSSADGVGIGEFFGRYKRHEPGKFSRVDGWGSAEEGRAYVETTHAFFRQCRELVGGCRLRSRDSGVAHF